MWKGVNVEQFGFTQTGIGPEGLSFDLFGDESIVFVYTPDHTMGLVATIINKNNKFAFLMCDVGYTRKSWEQMIMPGVQVAKNKVRNIIRMA